MYVCDCVSCVCVCVYTFVSIRRLVFLFVFPLSRGEQLSLIISNEPAVVKGPSHSLSPETDEYLISPLFASVCLWVCVWERSSSYLPLPLSSSFLTFTSLCLSFLFHIPYPLLPCDLFFSLTTPLLSHRLLSFTICPSSPPVGLCRDRGGPEQVLYLV